MNERIKGLISQAHILAAEQHRVNCLATGKDPSMPHAGALNMTFEKFAELIVRECTNICDDIADPTLYRGAEHHSRMAPGASYAAKVIKLRFGVEE